MSEYLAPVKWMTREEMKKLYPSTAKWPVPSFQDRVDAVNELLEQNKDVFEKAFTEAVLNGSCEVKIKDHGQGD